MEYNHGGERDRQDPVSELLENERRKIAAMCAESAARTQAIHDDVYAEAVQTVQELEAARTQSIAELERVKRSGNARQQKLENNLKKRVRKLRDEQHGSVELMRHENELHEQKMAKALNDDRKLTGEFKCAEEARSKQAIGNARQLQRQEEDAARRANEIDIARQTVERRKREHEAKTKIKRMHQDAAGVLEQALREQARVEDEERQKRESRKKKKTQSTEPVSWLDWLIKRILLTPTAWVWKRLTFRR